MNGVHEAEPAGFSPDMLHRMWQREQERLRRELASGDTRPMVVMRPKQAEQLGLIS